MRKVRQAVVPLVALALATACGDGGRRDPYEPPGERGGIVQVRGASGTVALGERTVAMLANARRWLGTHGGCDPDRLRPDVVTQGSYHEGVRASAGTHDGGGVIDLRVLGLDPREREAMIRALREAGFAAWVRRPPAFPWHVHAVAIGDPDLSAAARAQVASYFAGRDGLAERGGDPHGGPVVKRWMTPFLSAKLSP